MLYRETLIVILRRWRLSIPVVLLGFALGAGAYVVTPVEYSDQKAVLFLASSTSDKDGPINPYMNLSSALIASADIIRLSVTTPQAAEKLWGQGARAAYTVALDPATSAPVLNIKTSGTDPQVVAKTASDVLALIDQELRDRQTAAKAARSTWIQTTVVSSLDKPERSGKGRLQNAITGVAGTLVLALLGLFGLERRRLQHRPGAGPAAPAGLAGTPSTSGAAVGPGAGPAVDPAGETAPMPVPVTGRANASAAWPGARDREHGQPTGAPPAADARRVSERLFPSMPDPDRPGGGTAPRPPAPQRGTVLPAAPTNGRRAPEEARPDGDAADRDPGPLTRPIELP